MLVAKHTIHTSASPEAIWGKWSDVSSWKEWDKEIEFSDLDGPFDKESTGLLKPAGGPTTSFMITEVEPMKKFVDKSKLPLAEIIFSHEIKKLKKRTKLTHTVKINGPLGFLFRFLLGSKIREGLKRSMQELVEQIEKTA